MSEAIAVADRSLDPRADLRSAHLARDAARAEHDQVSGAVERARSELQRLLEAQRERDAARQAGLDRLVDARARGLLEGEGAAVVELVRPASDTDEMELAGEIETASAVAERLTLKLRDAEAAVRRAEQTVMAAAVALLVERGEGMARELEAGEAEYRAKRASLRALANLWFRGPGRPQPLPVGKATVWVLGDGNGNLAEAVTGSRAQRAHQLGHALPMEAAAPDWGAVLDRLLVDPDAAFDTE